MVYFTMKFANARQQLQKEYQRWWHGDTQMVQFPEKVTLKALSEKVLSWFLVFLHNAFLKGNLH